MNAETTRRLFLPAWGEGVPLEVHPAALPSRVQDTRGGGLDALVCVADDELHAAQTAPDELAEDVRPEGFPASEGPMDMPSTSRRPSVLTPTAMVSATETIRPPCRTFRYVASIQR